MDDLKKRSKDITQLEGLLEKHPFSISVSQIKKSLPKISFKNVNLSGWQNLDKALTSKSLTKVVLDDSLENHYLHVKGNDYENEIEFKNVNPLRKKTIPPQIANEKEYVQNKETFQDENIVPFIQETSKGVGLNYETKIVTEEINPDVTFNLKAQINQNEESIIFSPATVSMPPLKEDILSASGEQAAIVWPPISKESKVKDGDRKSLKRRSSKAKQKSKLKSKSKIKPYYLSASKAIKSKEENKKAGPIQELSVVEQSHLPWIDTEKLNKGVEALFSGNLESELLDLPPESDLLKDSPQKTEKQIIDTPPLAVPYTKSKELDNDIEVLYKKPSVSILGTGEFILRAVPPLEQSALISETVRKLDFKDINPDTISAHGSKMNINIDLLGKVENMFERFSSSIIVPVRIVLIGGVVATVGYMIWNYFLPDLKVVTVKSKKEKVVVRDLFKKKHIHSKRSLKQKIKEEIIVEAKSDISKEAESQAFKPITEEDRISLIEKARQALETRSDPFGQEAVLPSAAFEEEIEAEKPPPEIPVLRKQVELVGIISSENKNLALVNIYTADYSIILTDDQAARELKLKAAISMAVPNRVELSLLDPIEDWSVKAINKSLSRSEEPTIELVKGDKKFKLRVGQRILLPEEKPLPEPTSLDTASETSEADEDT